MRNLFYVALLFVAVVASSNGQMMMRRANVMRWCAVGDAELRKCQDWSIAMVQSGQFFMNLTCVLSQSKDDCMTFLDEDIADLVTLDTGEVFIGGRYHSLVPTMVERYGPGADSRYYAVGVVKRSSQIKHPYDLKNARACFTAVGQMAGWVLPTANLMRQNILEVTDCNNHLKSVNNFFGPSCAVNAMIDKYNPTGDNPYTLCEMCAGKTGIKCSGIDPFAGFDGAFRCLAKGSGDIAFLKHTTVEEMVGDRTVTGLNKNDFELLCPYGGRVPVDKYADCNWGVVPGHAIMTSSATIPEVRRRYQDIIRKSVQLFGGPPPQLPANQINMPQAFQQTQFMPFNLFQSNSRYGEGRNLLFQDTTSRLVALEESKQTFMDYLGEYEGPINELRKCPIRTVKMCVVSDMEMEKCHKMKMAFQAQMLKPDLFCFKGHSHRECMSSISQGMADIVMLDSGDIYAAGKDYGLIPIVEEHYNLDGPYYYAVAVAAIEDRDSDLLFLRGRYTCHTGMDTGAGWIIPISFLLKNDRLRNYGCDGSKAAAEFFQKSCIPGALSQEFNRNWKQNSMCDLCHGSSSSFCSRDHSEDFFGYTGAFRCLVEGGGEIAFIKHTTVFENTDGINQMWWARNLLGVDFELLCRDGSRAPIYEYETCNLGRVPSNAIVTRPGNDTVIDAYINLFMYAQQFYGSKYEEYFKFQMFQSEFPHHDLIFQDATQQLQPVHPDKRHYHPYLGHDFLQAKLAIDCTASASSTMAIIALVMLATILCLFCSS